MKSSNTTRSMMSLAASVMAGAAIIACSEGTPSIAGPRNDVTTTSTFQTGGQVDVCIAAGSPTGTYTVATTVQQPSGGSGVVTSSLNLTPGTCGTVFDRTAPQTAGSDVQSQVSVTVTSPSGAVVSDLDCVLDPGTSTPTDCTEPDGGAVDAVVFANFFHGTEATFTFVPVVVPPPPPPPVPTVEGCTVTRGFIKNQLDLLTNGIGKDITVTINGVTLTTAQIFAALDAPTRGDSRVQLKAQLITALANVSLGATTNATVDAAIAAAQSYLLAGSTATKAQITAAIETLTQFNEGNAGNGASDHCNGEEEAILKDKASA